MRNMEYSHTGFFLQIEDETQVSRATQAEQDHYEMHVRAANIVSRNSYICFKRSLIYHFDRILTSTQYFK